ncbi:MAG: TlpA family protein disulfide reductase [Hydrogenothermaceae bacterium]|nr:TlpA family protein disulfide reductase [Hydrogenothermaceae bacterium]
MKKIFGFLFIFLFAIKSYGEIRAPEFSLKDETGKVVKLSDLKNDVVFLTFWATTCHSCKRELPEISQYIYSKYKDKVKFYAIVIDSDNPKQIAAIKKDWKFDMPVLFGNSEVMEKYRIIGTPITYVIGKDNRLVKIFIGPQPIEKFEQAIKKALGEG